MIPSLQPMVENPESIPAAVAYLKAELGVKMTSAILQSTDADLRKWQSGKAEPLAGVKRAIVTAEFIVKTLRTTLPKNEVKLFFTEWNEYLWGVPGLELLRRPVDVEHSALVLAANEVNPLPEESE